MPDERQALIEIDALTQTLHRLDDRLGDRIKAREALLNQHNPKTRVSFGVCVGGEVCWGKYSGYWRFLWVSAAGTTPLASAPAHVRAAFSPMIDDVDRLLTAVATELRAEIKLREKP